MPKSLEIVYPKQPYLVRITKEHVEKAVAEREKYMPADWFKTYCSQSCVTAQSVLGQENWEKVHIGKRIAKFVDKAGNVYHYSVAKSPLRNHIDQWDKDGTWPLPPEGFQVYTLEPIVKKERTPEDRARQREYDRKRLEKAGTSSVHKIKGTSADFDGRDAGGTRIIGRTTL